MHDAMLLGVINLLNMNGDQEIAIYYAASLWDSISSASYLLHILVAVAALVAGTLSWSKRFHVVVFPSKYLRM